jgi:tRNA(Ile)-lysidine synthase
MASSRNKLPTDADLPLELARAVLARHVQPGDRVVLGLSGGIDSVVLLHFLRSRLPDIGATLSAFHVHHGLSANADHWRNFCASLCRDWDVPFEAVRIAVPLDGGEGVEAAARRVRHAAFADAVGDWLVLAHQRSDQAETLLFNLVRGCGLLGAAAMQECRDGRILRPLLDVSREAVAAYAARHALKWIDDESNADCRYSRNFLRRQVLPPLVERFPGAERNLAAAARRFGEALALLDELAALDLAGRAAAFPVPVRLFAGLSEARGRNLLRYLLAASGCRVPSAARLGEALRQIVAAAADRHPQVDLGTHIVYRHRGEVGLRPSSAAPPVRPRT